MALSTGHLPPGPAGEAWVLRPPVHSTVLWPGTQGTRRQPMGIVSWGAGHGGPGKGAAPPPGPQGSWPACPLYPRPHCTMAFLWGTVSRCCGVGPSESHFLPAQKPAPLAAPHLPGAGSRNWDGASLGSTCPWLPLPRPLPPNNQEQPPEAWPHSAWPVRVALGQPGGGQSPLSGHTPSPRNLSPALLKGQGGALLVML